MMNFNIRIVSVVIFGLICCGSFVTEANESGSVAEHRARNAYIIEQIKAGERNFEGADFWDMSFAALDMENIVLRNARLEKCNFKNADLRGADFTGADLTDASFEFANLQEAILEGANLTQTDFSYADLTNARIDVENNITSNGVRLCGTRGVTTWIQMRNAHIIEQIKAGERNFEGANFQDMSFEGLDMRGIILHNANVSACNFKNADLESADFTSTGICSFSLDMSGVNFTGANLLGANFAYAGLVNADFTGADLTLADFSRADLTGARIDKTTKLKKTRFFEAIGAVRWRKWYHKIKEHYEVVTGKIVDNHNPWTSDYYDRLQRVRQKNRYNNYIKSRA